MFGNILFVTHSSRSFQEEKASLNKLTKRFKNRDFSAFPLMESFAGLSESVSFTGALSIWELQDGTAPQFLAAYTPQYKVQYAIWHEGFIITLGHDRMEVLNTSLQVQKTITHPLLVGGHACMAADMHSLWVTCAPGNALLRVNIQSGEVERIIPMPERYGAPFVLDASFDLHKHMVSTDWQPTHINNVFCAGEDLLVTLCCQGAVGKITADGLYTELCSGYVGCHGGRYNSKGELYLSDTPAGLIWFMDAETGHLVDRFSTGSRWVHDCIECGEDIYACTLSDDNILRIISRKNYTTLYDVDLSAYGASAMFVQTASLPKAAIEQLRAQKAQQTTIATWDFDIFPHPSTWDFLDNATYALKENALTVSAHNVHVEYLLESPTVTLPAGQYKLVFEASLFSGGIGLGLEDMIERVFLSSVSIEGKKAKQIIFLTLEKETPCRLVLSASCVKKGALQAEIFCASLLTYAHVLEHEPIIQPTLDARGAPIMQETFKEKMKKIKDRILN